ncbi:MAG: hypothetical protein GX357_05670 [Firmicutes bacterium]|nr:hypothetical protein [Bacillota bacterium]
MKPILKWQYDQILKELILLQEHQTDPTCPCTTDGQMCVRKHLLAIEAYVQETMAMEENEYYKEKLKELADQVQEYRRQEEAALRNEAEHADLIEWSRDWRKTFEEYSLVGEEQLEM